MHFYKDYIILINFINKKNLLLRRENKLIIFYSFVLFNIFICNYLSESNSGIPANLKNLILASSASALAFTRSSSIFILHKSHYSFFLFRICIFSFIKIFNIFWKCIFNKYFHILASH